MPRPNHLVTPVFGFEYPELGAEADVPTDLHELELELETLLKAFPVNRLSTPEGGAKDLLIVQAGGFAAWKAMSGDATISEAGAITIANEAVNAAKILNLAINEAKLAGESVGNAKIAALAVTATKLAAEAVETAKIKGEAVTEAKLAALAVSTAKIANLAVTEGKIADAAVTSRKHKPSHGLVKLETTTKLLAEMKEMPGMKLEITPATASILRVWFTASFGGPANTIMRALITVDGAEQAEAIEVSTPSSSEQTFNMGSMFYEIPLTAALHTIKVNARRQGVSGEAFIKKAVGESFGGGTQYMWDLISQ